MKISFKEFQKYALGLPGTEEKPHFEKTSFRIHNRIFATYDPSRNRGMIILDDVSQSVFCSIPDGGFSMVNGAWGKQGCTFVDLDNTRKDVWKEALQKGYDFILSKKSTPKKSSKVKSADPISGATDKPNRTYDSAFNGRLEISIQRGKKVLDTKNTNYSYGTVHQVWNKTLRKTSLDKVKSTLLLGLGGGSVIELLRNSFGYTGKLTAVEIDPVIIRIAKEEFGITNNAQTSIICQDAFQFVVEDKKKHDLILVDLFLDNLMPDQTVSLDFWDNIQRLLKPHGLVIFNVFNRTGKLKKFVAAMKKRGWDVVIHAKVNGSNTMIFASRIL